MRRKLSQSERFPASNSLAPSVEFEDLPIIGIEIEIDIGSFIEIDVMLVGAVCCCLGLPAAVPEELAADDRTKAEGERQHEDRTDEEPRQAGRDEVGRWRAILEAEVANVVRPLVDAADFVEFYRWATEGQTIRQKAGAQDCEHFENLLRIRNRPLGYWVEAIVALEHAAPSKTGCGEEGEGECGTGRKPTRPRAESAFAGVADKGFVAELGSNNNDQHDRQYGGERKRFQPGFSHWIDLGGSRRCFGQATGLI